MTQPPAREIERYVAIGDSSSEGLDDPDDQGGYRGWADRLAETIAVDQPALLYANLAIRGRRTRRIRAEQLAPALALAPDLVTLSTGTNDVVARRFQLDAIAEDLVTIHHAVRDTGATLLTFTLPDLAPVMPLARWLGDRINALNSTLRAVTAETGALLVDFAAHPMASDPRLWSEDRLHANSAGHARMAAALAQALALPGAGGDWAEPLPPAPTASLLARGAAEARWVRRYLAPWIWRHARGRSSGDSRRAKRPGLEPVLASSPKPPSVSC